MVLIKQFKDKKTVYLSLLLEKYFFNTWVGKELKNVIWQDG